MTSRPANRTAWREEENRSSPGQPAGHRQRGERPDAVQPLGQDLGAGQVPGRLQQLMPQLAAAGSPVPRSPPGRWRPAAARPGTGSAAETARSAATPGPVRSAPSPRAGAPWWNRTAGPLHPGGVLRRRSWYGLQHRPAFQDVAGRDPAFRQPPLGQQHPQVPAVGLIGLGVPLAAAGERGVGRLGQMRRDAGRGQLLGDIPPPGAPLDRERDVIAAGGTGPARPAGAPGRPG